DPETRVMVRAQRVPHGLAIEVEDRAIPMHPQTRAQMNHLLKAPDEVDVSGQVRAGQLGLLVAAKIAQSHGMTVLLQENTTGGTTALVVIPARLLVAIPSVEDAGPPPPEEARGSGRQPQQVAATPAVPEAAQAARRGVAESPTAEASQSTDAPALPTRTRRTGSFRPPQEREQAPVSAATPGLAAAFRNGLQAGGSASPSPASTEHPTP
ncbi:ATP-binding protein, partial [Streptomyces rochei]